MTDPNQLSQGPVTPGQMAEAKSAGLADIAAMYSGDENKVRAAFDAQSSVTDTVPWATGAVAEPGQMTVGKSEAVAASLGGKDNTTPAASVIDTVPWATKGMAEPGQIADDKGKSLAAALVEVPTSVVQANAERRIAGEIADAKAFAGQKAVQAEVVMGAEAAGVSGIEMPSDATAVQTGASSQAGHQAVLRRQ